MKTKIFALFLTVLMSLSALIGCAQVKKYTEFYGYGVKYLRTLSDSALGMPKDTFSIPSQYRAWPHLAARDTTLFMWIPSLSYWKEVTSTSTTPGGGGAAPRWGDITGTLYNQLDLRDSLEARQRRLPAGSSLQYWDAQGSLRRFDSLARVVGDTRYLKLADYEAFGGVVDSNRFFLPLYEMGGDVYLDYGLPTYNANKLQGYLIHPGEPAHGSYLRFDSADQRWEMDTAGIKLGSNQITEADPVYTAQGVPKTRQLTINGTAYDLSADRAWTIQVPDARFWNPYDQDDTLTANRDVLLGGYSLDLWVSGTAGGQHSFRSGEFYTNWRNTIGADYYEGWQTTTAYGAAIHALKNTEKGEMITGSFYGTRGVGMVQKTGDLSQYIRVHADSTVIGAWTRSAGDVYNQRELNLIVRNLPSITGDALVIDANGKVGKGSAVGSVTTFYTGNGTFSGDRKATISAGNDLWITQLNGSDLYMSEGYTSLINYGGGDVEVMAYGLGASVRTGHDSAYMLIDNAGIYFTWNSPYFGEYGMTLQEGGNFGVDGVIVLGSRRSNVPAMWANRVQIWAEDVGGIGEMRVKDAAGNITTLSPHNFSGIPQGRSEEMAWAYYSEREGKYINVDMLRLARLVEQLTGEKLVFTGNIPQ